MLGRVFNYGLNGYHGLDWIKPFNPIQIFLSRKKLKKDNKTKIWSLHAFVKTLLGLNVHSDPESQILFLLWNCTNERLHKYDKCKTLATV